MTLPSSVILYREKRTIGKTTLRFRVQGMLPRSLMDKTMAKGPLTTRSQM